MNYFYNKIIYIVLVLYLFLFIPDIYSLGISKRLSIASFKRKIIQSEKTLNIFNKECLLILADNYNKYTGSDWARILSAGNSLDVMGKKIFDKEIQRLKNILNNPESLILDIDAGNLFNKFVFNKPQKLAIFTDNRVEIKLNLFYVLAQVYKYQELDPYNKKDWEVAIISKREKNDLDASYKDIIFIINNDRDLKGLKYFIKNKKIKIFDKCHYMQGVNIRNLDKKIVKYLNDLNRSSGTIISLGIGNETLRGIESAVFSFFKVKNKRLALLSGSEKGRYAVSYKPSFYTQKIKKEFGFETMKGITLFEQIKYYFQNNIGKKLCSEAGIILPESFWIYLLPLLSFLNNSLEDYSLMFVERGGYILVKPWNFLIEYLNKNTKINFKQEYTTKKISTLDKLGKEYLSWLINSFLSDKEREAKLSNDNWEIFINVFTKSLAKRKILKNNNIKDMRDYSRQKLVRIIAPIGIDDRYEILNLRKRFCSNKDNSDWKLKEKDYKILELYSLEIKDQAIELLNKYKLNKKEYNNKMLKLLENACIQVCEEMRGYIKHKVRPLLNIILKGTETERKIQNTKIIFMDDVVGMGRTSITCELLVKSFKADTNCIFSAVLNENRFSKACDIFSSSDNKERLLENRPELVPILGYKGTKTYWHRQELNRLKKIQKTEFLKAKEDKEEYEKLLNKFIHENLFNYDNITLEQKKWIIKYCLRKSIVSKIYLEDYLAPVPWKHMESTSYHNTREKIISELFAKLKNFNNIEELKSLDKKYQIFEEVLVLENWLKIRDGYVKQNKQGVLTLNDAKLRNLVVEYIETGIAA